MALSDPDLGNRGRAARKLAHFRTLGRIERYIDFFIGGALSFEQRFCRKTERTHLGGVNFYAWHFRRIRNVVIVLYMAF